MRIRCLNILCTVKTILTKPTLKNGIIAHGSPLWSSGQSSWLQIQRSRVRFPTLPDFLRSSESGMGSSLPREYTQELLGRKSSGSSLESWEYGLKDLSRWPRGTLCPQKLSSTSPPSGGHSVGIVLSRTQATEFVYLSKFMLPFNLASDMLVTFSSVWSYPLPFSLLYIYYMFRPNWPSSGVQIGFALQVFARGLLLPRLWIWLISDIRLWC
jgi:hypothetical protein